MWKSYETCIMKNITMQKKFAIEVFNFSQVIQITTFSHRHSLNVHWHFSFFSQFARVFHLSFVSSIYFYSFYHISALHFVVLLNQKSIEFFLNIPRVRHEQMLQHHQPQIIFALHTICNITYKNNKVNKWPFKKCLSFLHWPLKQ